MITNAGNRLRARTQCFACGQGHPSGLRLRFEPQNEGDMVAEWRPGREWEGFSGVVHGGVVSAVLDEAMSKAVAGIRTEALTAELRVRFRRHVCSGEAFLVRGWIVKRSRRLIETEATLAALDGSEHAHAWARFLALPAG